MHVNFAITTLSCTAWMSQIRKKNVLGHHSSKDLSLNGLNMPKQTLRVLPTAGGDETGAELCSTPLPSETSYINRKHQNKSALEFCSERLVFKNNFEPAP